MKSNFETSIGFHKKSELMSQTCGTGPVSRNVWNCVPKSVLFEVVCAYAEFVSNFTSACVGTRV